MMRMTKKIRWGMIGCGDVTEVKSGPAFSKAEGSLLQTVMCRHGERAADYARRHGVPQWTDDAQALIENPAVDAVYIATPPDSHLHYTRMVAAAGKPVFSEKPMARDPDEAQAMAESCAQAGVPLHVAYYRRALPRFLKVRDWIEAGRIGSARFFHIQHSLRPEAHPVAPITGEMAARGEVPWRYLPEVGGGGNFMDMGTHMIDMIDFLLGPIREVEGRADNFGGLYPAEDTISARFLLESGVHGTGQWCYVAGTNEDRIEILGDRGALRFSCFDEAPLELETETGTHRVEAPNPPHVHQPLVQLVTDALLGRGSSPSTAENGLRALRVQGAILAGYRMPPRAAEERQAVA